jgi:Ni,Fe-hydrogenase I cytochrome b subunit
MIEAICFSLIIGLTVTNYFIALPIHLNITAFSLAIIIAGANRSLHQMISQFKVVHVDKQKMSGVETMTKEDAMQFPL